MKKLINLLKEGSLPTKVSDKIKKLKHEPKTDVEKDFMKHHTTSMGADKMGRLSEPDTYDWDDDDEEIGGYQKEKDKKKKGYEPMENIKLKNLVKESEVLTEGTRWLVGIEKPNGKILSTYGHYDGYPEWAGKHLKKYYNNPAKAKELLKLGRSGISSIGKKIKGSKNHSFDNPEKDTTIFYGRDRGEKTNYTSNWKDRDSVKFNSGEEYAYIYNLKDKKWYYKSRYSNPQDWTELK